MTDLMRATSFRWQLVLARGSPGAGLVGPLLSTKWGEDFLLVIMLCMVFLKKAVGQLARI